MDDSVFIIDRGNDETVVTSTLSEDLKSSANNVLNEKPSHPLEHLFQEVEDVKAKPVETKPQVSLSENLYSGLSSRIKEKLAPVLDHKKKKDEITKLLSKSAVLSPEFEKQFAIGELYKSDKKLREERRKEREKTKGSKWFGLGAPEITEEVKRDLEILQMRSVLDPKRFYKKNDNKVLPKYFQIGKVMDSPLDYYSNRLTNKERKKTLVDELMADAQFKKYSKAKYVEIITERQKTHYKAWKQAKKLKKRNNCI
ncbi:hypothetical protein WA026_011566 [Henosepilachna vigintioctopunctata]|uniref:Fcf2 pre-rRNA processing C-terminal domain-containing protein n=1 Tax=Henosepilachna vigintioctopunctata TaxID=420089 RepID=A0AAW1TSK3_9CUCU